MVREFEDIEFKFIGSEIYARLVGEFEDGSKVYGHWFYYGDMECV